MLTAGMLARRRPTVAVSSRGLPVAPLLAPTQSIGSASSRAAKSQAKPPVGFGAGEEVMLGEGLDARFDLAYRR